MRSFHVATLAGIPISINLFYLLLLYFFSRGDLRSGVLWAVVITVGLLVHEFGHALVARYFKLQPAVTLHGFGGLTNHQPAERDVDDALIIAMGPAAGLMLGMLGIPAFYAMRQLAPEMGPAALNTASEALYAFFFVNVGWSVVNLLPLWPLDGGQLTRLGLRRLMGTARADRVTHRVGIGLSLVLMVVLFRLGATFTLLILGLLAFQNYQALRGNISSGASRTSGDAIYGELLARARAAFDAGNYAEAARLGHQLRAMSPPADVLEQTWTLLGLSTARLDEPEEALRYLKRAPDSGPVRDAIRDCLVALDREDEVPELVQRKRVKRPGRHAGRWLRATLLFYAIAVAVELPFLLRFL